MTDFTSMIGDMASGAMKGAAAGSVVPGIGTAIGAGVGGLLGVALNLAPGLLPYATEGSAVAQNVAAAVKAVTGTNDPQVAQAALFGDAQMTSELYAQLAQIAADAKAEENRSQEARLTAAIADTHDARAQMQALAAAGSVLSWGAPIISVIVLLSFALAMGLALTRAVPDASMPLLNVLLGSLTAMATSVVSYWVGSSAGSASKDNRLAQMVPASLLPKPAAIVPVSEVGER